MEGIEALLSTLGPKALAGRLLLDAGCGEGRAIPDLVRAGWKVVGCDLSRKKLSQARAGLQSSGVRAEIEQWFSGWEIVLLDRFSRQGKYGERVGWDVVVSRGKIDGR